MKLSTFIFLVFLWLFPISTTDGQSVKQVRIFVPDRAALNQIWSAGIDHEGAIGNLGGWIDFVAGEEELNELTAKGIKYTVIIDDLSEYFARRLAPGPYDALGFGYGSMGGYYTLAEVGQQLDSLRLLYPNLITEKEIIGTSLENRPIWAVKMTAGVNTPTQRPQVLYNALTHAREPMGMMVLLYFMWHLAENYGSDPEVTYLLDNRELWFVPVVNPDGYEANRRMNPNGGGMRRKNMRSVQREDDSYGVDLNRNYGYHWGFDDRGSSPTPSSQVYRGTAPFSEPETQVIRDFCLQNNFHLALNYHTYGNLFIYPWGYLPSTETPDSLLYREYARDMTRYNRYRFGTGDQTVNYVVNGDADDWMYGEQTTKNKIISMTPEVGTSADRFWPPTNRIFPLAQENLYPNLYLAWAAGGFPHAHAITIKDASGNGYLERGERFDIETLIRNKGLEDAQGIEVTVESLSPSLTLFSHRGLISNLSTRADTLFRFPGRVSLTAITGTEARLVVRTWPGPDIAFSDTLTIMLGVPVSVRDDLSVPTEFALHQNYPNPFNPQTVMEFDLPSREFVSLRVYNLLGQEVASLLNEELQPGRYSLQVNSSQFSLASGVYFYKLTAGSFRSTKKMILTR